MASLMLMASELLRHRKCGAAAILASYPPSSTITSSSFYGVRKPLKDDVIMQNKNNQRTEETVVENPFESRICVDFVWP
ncbi:hypothetical protein Lal_00044780 [Lupinus albus]|uniref:Uncharacterized protein n=1 Tax=Lupinus albus TaxID=3870 RepID=A0A6A4NIU8_LUPAL|nr:hypothetical protein Lalb_Chr24g0403131 [Lupinus albus]KAF1858747.1 hypothetical protein Lal_00044780 [Lupinus albus]